MINTVRNAAPQQAGQMMQSPQAMANYLALAQAMMPPPSNANTGAGLSGLNLNALAQMASKPDDGKPDPIFGYGIGNGLARLGVGSTYGNSAATGALASNAPGGFGFASSY